ncbi:uncharacterized protein L969DRAFT_94666 [Mixia osmundae IAM 14324]|uniref:Uncharacterized protein n=1 Tax=Mixia osmundae (strain CBS 9802 / IAM 14324 / JCM 22182 / KY 12970) TaxID=764103 RepID=G7DVU6_MIXOS|nr:uncharacterized protein L969DRAFT_94666 [Mixia osmundae IAM 14324]KEI39615.1 hypothetical protein L969DRAFT_94666 [Mixia osmundae IAM 14324]GAA94706.1 hypothetical protein E5Q_01359 [Mixia osmundae IAM 14324]
MIAHYNHSDARARYASLQVRASCTFVVLLHSMLVSICVFIWAHQAERVYM